MNPLTPRSSDPLGRLAAGTGDPGLARERTALAWTRSALNMAAVGTLVARAAFVGHLDALGVATAVAMGTLAALVWHHGQVIYRERQHPGMPPHVQAGAFSLLTVATVLSAATAVIVTIAF